MKRTFITSKVLVLVALILLGAGHIPLTFAQGVEAEPNHPCTSAQDFGAITLPFTVNGSLDSIPASPDVDFFKFTGTPGTSVRADLEGLTLGDPFLLQV